MKFQVSNFIDLNTLIIHTILSYVILSYLILSYIKPSYCILSILAAPCYLPSKSKFLLSLFYSPIFIKSYSTSQSKINYHLLHFDRFKERGIIIRKPRKEFLCSPLMRGLPYRYVRTIRTYAQHVHMKKKVEN